MSDRAKSLLATPEGRRQIWQGISRKRGDEGRDIGGELLQSVREAKQMLFPDGFPCGWDERDAKV